MSEAGLWAQKAARSARSTLCAPCAVIDSPGCGPAVRKNRRPGGPAGSSLIFFFSVWCGVALPRRQALPCGRCGTVVSKCNSGHSAHSGQRLPFLALQNATLRDCAAAHVCSPTPFRGLRRWSSRVACDRLGLFGLTRPPAEYLGHASGTLLH